MIAIHVSHCADCPFSLQDVDGWACAADVEAIRDLGPRQESKSGPWLPPPEWCPLRDADRIVTLRAP